MLELRLNGQVLAQYGEGATIELPNGMYVAGAVAGPIHGTDYELVTYVAPPRPDPTIEEIRANMPPITARQLRLALLSIDLQEADVDMMLVNDPAGMVEWKYASYYKRTHPLIESVGTAKGLLPEHIDSMWEWAMEL